jgi:hypothetical protein
MIISDISLRFHYAELLMILPLRHIDIAMPLHYAIIDIIFAIDISWLFSADDSFSPLLIRQFSPL